MKISTVFYVLMLTSTSLIARENPMLKDIPPAGQVNLADAPLQLPNIPSPATQSGTSQQRMVLVTPNRDEDFFEKDLGSLNIQFLGRHNNKMLISINDGSSIVVDDQYKIQSKSGVAYILSIEGNNHIKITSSDPEFKSPKLVFGRPPTKESTVSSTRSDRIIGVSPSILPIQVNQSNGGGLQGQNQQMLQQQPQQSNLGQIN